MSIFGPVIYILFTFLWDLQPLFFRLVHPWNLIFCCVTTQGIQNKKQNIYGQISDLFGLEAFMVVQIYFLRDCFRERANTFLILSLSDRSLLEIFYHWWSWFLVPFLTPGRGGNSRLYSPLGSKDEKVPTSFPRVDRAIPPQSIPVDTDRNYSGKGERVS